MIGILLVRRGTVLNRKFEVVGPSPTPSSGRECESRSSGWTTIEKNWPRLIGLDLDGRIMSVPVHSGSGDWRSGTLGQTTEAGDLLSRLRAGDLSARASLIVLAQGRFAALARAMLRRYPHVRRWEETDDLLQVALMRLHRSLVEVRPEDVPHFDNLAATQIRRELIDLARSYHGPEGIGANHHTDAADPGVRLARVTEASGQPESLEEWTAFHEAVERLPDEERRVMDLLWYRGLTHAQAAESLGVATKTVQRRWASARLMIRDALKIDESHGE
jgi:RNA polymerase sigma factor (sigma-70 family)